MHTDADSEVSSSKIPWQVMAKACQVTAKAYQVVNKRNFLSIKDYWTTVDGGRNIFWAICRHNTGALY